MQTQQNKVRIQQYFDISYAYTKLDDGLEACILEYKQRQYIQINVDHTNHSKTTSSHYTQAIAILFDDNIYLYNHVMKLYKQCKAYDKKLCNANAGSNYRDQMQIYLDKNGLLLTGDSKGCIYACDNKIQAYIPQRIA